MLLRFLRNCRIQSTSGDLPRSSATYSICTTTNAPVEFINAFLRKHLDLSTPPEHIYLFLDDPDTCPRHELLHDKRVKIIECDDAYWRNRPWQPGWERVTWGKYHERPENIESRQHYNILRTYAQAETDWLISIDIDEELFSKEDIAAILAAQPENVFSIHIQNVEAIYEVVPNTVDEVHSNPYFKQPHPQARAFWDEIYAELPFTPNRGYWAYQIGKGFIRTGHDLRALSNHFPTPYRQDLICRIEEPRIRLLHHEPLTVDMFTDKTIKRAIGKYNAPYAPNFVKEREQYLHSIWEQEQNDGLAGAYEQMYVLASSDLRRAVEAKYVMDTRLWVSPNASCLATVHGGIIGFDTTTQTCIAVPPDALNGNQYLPVLVAHTRDTAARQEAYLYVFYNGTARYLYADRNGVPFLPQENTGFISRNAMPLSFVAKSGKAAFKLGREYLSARKNGAVAFVAPKLDKWEWFKLADIEQ